MCVRSVFAKLRCVMLKTNSNTWRHCSVILYDNVAEQSQLCFMPLCARTVVPPGTTVLGSCAILLSVGEPHQGGPLAGPLDHGRLYYAVLRAEQNKRLLIRLCLVCFVVSSMCSTENVCDWQQKATENCLSLCFLDFWGVRTSKERVKTFWNRWCRTPMFCLD